jgi:hypothetical protein
LAVSNKLWSPMDMCGALKNKEPIFLDPLFLNPNSKGKLPHTKLVILESAS